MQHEAEQDTTLCAVCPSRIPMGPWPLLCPECRADHAWTRAQRLASAQRMADMQALLGKGERILHDPVAAGFRTLLDEHASPPPMSPGAQAMAAELSPDRSPPHSYETWTSWCDDCIEIEEASDVERLIRIAGLA